MMIVKYIAFDKLIKKRAFFFLGGGGIVHKMRNSIQTELTGKFVRQLSFMFCVWLRGRKEGMTTYGVY